MAYVVTENCIKCKHTDCCEVCPVDCFYEGENMMVIHPDECIDCALCVLECPIDAIKHESDPDGDKWLMINADLAEIWPVLTVRKGPLPDADEWDRVPNKIQYLVRSPGQGD